MKIYAFEVSDYEIEYFKQMEKTLNVSIELFSGLMDFGNLPDFEEGSGVCVLALREYHKEELDILKEAGVRYFSTRTVGYNHIDVAYAKEIGLHVCAGAYPPNGVADYTVMMILLCLRNYKQALWRTQVNDFSLDGLMGRELKDLTIGILGTGKIGACVARNLSGFGCKLIAYDQYENDSIKDIVTYMDLEDIYRKADVITLHMPLFDSTYHIINDESIAKMKDGVIILNFARDLLVDDDAMEAALKSGKVKRYITDFPNDRTAKMEGVVAIPHLGASTEESEDNCAKMAVRQVMDFLENGNIINSVNFPNCDMGVCNKASRITILHKNIPNTLSKFTMVLSTEDINISDLVNRSRGEYAYTMLDLDHVPSETAVAMLKKIDGVLRVRVIR